MAEAPELILIGGGGHARVVIEAARQAGAEVAGLLDAKREIGDQVDGVPVLGDDAWLAEGDTGRFRFHVAIADNAVRARLRRRLAEFDADIAAIAHPAATVSASAAIGAGCFLAAGAIVNPGVRLADGAIINTGAQIDHDCQIGSDGHIAPGAVLCGFVRCGDRVLVGAGATIIQGVSVGGDATIGAGATVVRDVADGQTMTGTPARPV